MRNKLLIILPLIMLVTVSSANVDNNSFEFLFQFEEEGYIVQEVSFNETIPLNGTTGLWINITKSGTRGVNFTLVVIYDENAIVLLDYNDYGPRDDVFISRNVTEHFQFTDELNFAYAGLLTVSKNSTDNPYKLLIIMYYEGTGMGEIKIAVSLINNPIVDYLFDTSFTESSEISLYLPVFVLFLLTYQRKMKKIIKCVNMN